MAKQLKKKQVIEIFGTVTALAKAVGVVPQAISRWPAVLKPYHIDAVISAAWRLQLPRHAASVWVLDRLEAIGVKVDRRINDI